ncbi:MAG: helix-turn-helix domain-containing protein [Zoogloeaceae bacterium]|nr:helix-turn-helix domain-containing protein [Zoogloeaceae bacterium]
MEPKKLKTRGEIIEDCRRKGISIAALARTIGIDRMTVYRVLHDERANSYGKAHKAAVLLGIKDGVIVEDEGHANA